ncbi:MAG: STAS domain-containing protein [Clostridia bacterium]|nr:STAS domain-containing protein [Clostridia bacterium]
MNRVLENEKIILKMESDLTVNIVRNLVEKAKQYIECDDFELVELDISNVKFVDSIGISFIIGLYKSAKNLNKKFKITGSNEDIYKLFCLMKLDSVFEIECA